MIRADRLTRAFGTRVAVDALTFEAQPGEILGLLGPNGAGKTTTLRMLAGIIAPTSGTASVAGIDPGQHLERIHEHIGFLTESPGFYERLSAARNLAYFAAFYPNLDVANAVRASLRTMGLLDRAHDKVGTFSKGMKQKLALARTLLHQPEVLFLDEPTSGLDPEAAKNLRELILQLKGEGRTILLSTHNLSEAEAICDRIGVFQTRLVALDTTEALRDRQFAPQVRVEIRNMTNDLIAAISAEVFVNTASRDLQDPSTLIVSLQDIDRDRPKLVSRLVSLGAEVLQVREDERSLEDVYLSLVREDTP
ncbi:ABC transporter ATP-binding protein [Candidatus Bipolaricaulota bacterium]|nr:ABC transporter ATP-binding protein [Candidatus Bipolaricaulota bacterium]